MSTSTLQTHPTLTPSTENDWLPSPEEVVVATVLVSPEVAAKVFPRLSPEDFANPRLAWIYEAARDLASRGENIDPVLLLERLKEQGRLEAFATERHSPATFLSSLFDSAIATPANIASYVQRVRRAARARRFELLLRQAVLDLERGTDAEIVYQTLCRTINELGPTLAPPTRSDDALLDIVTDLMAKVEAQTPRGWSWPWPSMEESVGRLLPGSLWVVVGYSGSGKSVWLRSIALGLIMDPEQDVSVAYFAVEERGEDVLGLMACAHGGLNYRRFGLGMKLTDEEVDLLAKAVQEIYLTRRLTINRRKIWSPTELLAQIRVYAEEEKAKVVIIDHAHLVDYPGKTEKERDHQMGVFAERLHALADETGICVLAAYQPRKPDVGTDEFRPVTVHDVRGTGRVVNIAENTLSPYRPWVEWDRAWGREKLDDQGRPILAKKPRAQGSRLVQNYAFIQPGKRRVGGYGGGPVILNFNPVTGRIYEAGHDRNDQRPAPEVR